MKLQNIRPSDVITTVRIFFVVLVALLISFEPKLFDFIPGVALIIFIFTTDVFDGIVARKLNDKSVFGGFYDITGDRITESVLIVPFVYLGIATPIVLIYFITKGFLIDYIRLKTFALNKKAPFEQLQNKFVKFLVSHRLLRAVIGTLKIVMIILFYAQIFNNKHWIEVAANIVVISTIIISLLRSFPPIWEYCVNTYLVKKTV